MPSSNRRAFFRQRMHAAITIHAAGIRTGIPATLVEISGGGCNVECRMQFRAGTAVRFELLTLTGRLTLAGAIRSVRYRSRERSFSYGVALEFKDERARDQLMKMVFAEQIRERNRVPFSMPRGIPQAPDEREPRVRLGVQVTVAVEGSSARFEGIATDVARGGMRLETDRVLRQEWRLRVIFALPGESALPLTVVARALPGVHPRGGAYVHRLRFDDLDAAAAEELERFIDFNTQAANTR